MPMMPTTRPFAFRQPTDPALLLAEAIAHQEAGRLAEARTRYEQLLRIDPNRPDILTLYAILLTTLGQMPEAIRLLTISLRADPGQPTAYNALGGCYFKQGRLIEALENFDRALALGLETAHRNRGVTLSDLGRWQEALDAFDQALRFEPHDGIIYRDRVRALLSQRRYHEAIATLDRALELRPDFPEAEHIKAEALLMIGDYHRAWPLLERRWDMVEAIPLRREFHAPKWHRDKPAAGRTILLYGEQGFGDSLQFCRFVPRITALGSHVVLEVPPPLCALMTTVDPSIRVIPRQADPGLIDYQCSLMSIPFALDLGADDVVMRQPYLHADPQRLAAWEQRLNEMQGAAGVGEARRKRVGLVWFGSMGGGTANHKSMAFEDMAVLIDCNADFFALQKDHGPDDSLLFQSNEQVTHLGPFLTDFAETAAAMMAMDLVITVDTAAAHLAGALGLPVWILLPVTPEWRWPDTGSTPWYPSARLFRQVVSNDWDHPLAMIHEALSAWIGAA